MDELYKYIPGQVGTAESFSKRDSPIIGIRQLGVVREITLKRAEQLSAELGAARSSLPILRIGKLSLFTDKVEIGVTVLGIALKGSAQVPLGLVAAADDSASNSWATVRNHPDFRRMIRSASAIIKETVDRITVLADNLREGIEADGPYKAAQCRGQVNIDHIISTAIRSEHRPPAQYARFARNLNLKDAGLTSIENVTDCIDVETIDLDQNTGLSDVTSLESCSKLQFVRLGDTLIPDVNFIQSLSRLRKIDSRGTEVANF